MRRIECDILIMGFGAAGGVLAATLADSPGKRIVLVEKGGHFGEEFFNQREWDMNVLFAGDGVRSTGDGSIPVRGGEVGGRGHHGEHRLVLRSGAGCLGSSYPRFTSRDQAVHCSGLRFTPHQTTITSAHCQATVKMGEDPERSMVNSRGESHAFHFDHGAVSGTARIGGDVPLWLVSSSDAIGGRHRPRGGAGNGGCKGVIAV